MLSKNVPKPARALCALFEKFFDFRPHFFELGGSIMLTIIDEYDFSRSRPIVKLQGVRKGAPTKIRRGPLEYLLGLND